MAFQFPQPPRHEHAFARPLDPEPARLPHWRCTLTDRGAWPDPLQPLAFPFWTPPGLEAFAVNGARFEAAASEMPSAGLWLGLDAYEAIVAEVGYDDDGQQSEEPDEWIAQAETATAPILALIRQADGSLRQWRGESEVLRRLAEAVCRAHGLSDGAVGRVVGRCVRRRSLFKAAAIARGLEAKKRADEQARAAAQAEAVAVQVEDERPRTLAELHVHAFAVKRDRLGAIPFLVPTQGAAPIGFEPWTGAARYYVFDLNESDERVYAFRALAAMASPNFARDGVRALPSETVLPATALPAADPDMHAACFLCARRIEAGLDFGRVTNLRAEVPERAHALAREHARLLLSPAPQHAWRTDWLVEVLVRSELAIRPDVALERALLPALDDEFRKQNPATMKPAGVVHIEHGLDGQDRFVPPPMKQIRMFLDEQLPSRTTRAVLGDKLAAAVERGAYVAAAEALDPMTSGTTKSPKGRK